MAFSATLTSSAGTSAIQLNPVAKSTTLIFTVTGGSSGAVTIEGSLDDTTIPGGPTAIWAPLSSGVAMLSSLVTTGLIYTVLSPLAQVRINSTANDKTLNTLTLRALQSVTA